MTQHQPRPTAKIYSFPKKPRATSDSHRGYTPAHKQADLPAVEFGAGWYHEAAVEEAKENQKVRYRKH